MKIALVQMSMAPNLEINAAKSLALMVRARSQGADIVCFPELQFTPFFPQHPARDVSVWAMELNHPVVQQFAHACRELRMVAALNLYLSEGGKTFDASPVIDDDGCVLGTSKMVHIMQAPCFYEQDYYAPADTGFRVYRTAVGVIGVVVCFDRHFPESFRACVLQGAQLIVIPTANVKGEPLDIFEAELRTAAFQNGVFIAMCNRVGLEDEMDFCGESMVVDPFGKVLAKASGLEEIVCVELDLSLVDEARKVRPYLKLRRTDAYW